MESCNRRAAADEAAIVPEAKTETTRTIYSCPMHPQIRQVRPGSCPICGIRLNLTVDTDDNPELKDFRRRFFWTLPLTVFVAVLARLVIAATCAFVGGLRPGSDARFSSF
jgi:Cu+-exporting ATPase